MIVTRNNIGVDKLTLFYNEYRVKDLTRAGLTVHPGTVDLDTGASSDRHLFTDSRGGRVTGQKAIKNTPLYQATIKTLAKTDSSGVSSALVVQLNPSKPWHPFDLVSDGHTLKDRVQLVFDDLKKSGILAPWGGGQITRLDLARNILTENPVSSYSAVWPWLHIKRERHQRQYPSGYGTSNDTWGAIFYDKGQEVNENAPPNKPVYPGGDLLRGELQFKRARAVGTKLGCKLYYHIEQAGFSSLQAVYRTMMQNDVLRTTDTAKVHTIRFNDEIQVLRKLIADSPRTAIGKHIQLMGVPTFIDLYGSPKVYAEVLREAGFSRMTISRQVKQVRKQIELYSALYRDERNSVGKMIRELNYKLSA